jgi:hypothetical protein
LVVFDAALREKIAALYRNAYLLRVGGRMIAYGSIFPPFGTFSWRCMPAATGVV